MVIVGYGLALLYSYLQSRMNYAKPKPEFTIKKKIQHFNVKRELSRIEEVLAVFRADGSYSANSTFFALGSVDPDQIREKRTIVETHGRQQVVIYPFLASKMTKPLSQEMAKKLQAPTTSDCNDGASLIDPHPSPSQIAGYRVIKSTVKRRLKDIGEFSIEKWMAPDLGCYALRQIETKTSPDGVPGAYNVHEVRSVTLGKPDPKLFEIPSHFVERSPTEILTEADRRSTQK